MVKTHGVSPRDGSRDEIAWFEIGTEWFRTHLAILTQAEAAANRSERTEGLSHLGVNAVLAHISRVKTKVIPIQFRNGPSYSCCRQHCGQLS
jgi:hypothetical protein